jgi:segregation and condensation protein A
VNPADEATRSQEPVSALAAPATDTTPDTIDGVAFARLYGEPLFKLQQDLYNPPDALEVFLETFEGPLDLLLYLIRKQNFNVLDIPMADVTVQYLGYVEQLRQTNLELASEYLLMAAMLIEIKSRMLLPVKKADTGEEAEDPRAELVRRLLEYERIKLAAFSLVPILHQFIAHLVGQHRIMQMHLGQAGNGAGHQFFDAGLHGGRDRNRIAITT